MAVVVGCLLALGGCGADAGEADRARDDRFTVAEPLPDGLAGRPAPRIRLTDARGGTFDTDALAGAPYLVTFVFVACPDVCPLIGQEIRQALERLGPDGREVSAVAVSVDPRGDTPEAVRVWLRRQGQPARFHYLIGSERELAPVWRAWYAAPQVPGDPESAHSAVVWLVDAEGRLAAKVGAGGPFDPDGLARDLRTLLGADRT